MASLLRPFFKVPLVYILYTSVYFFVIILYIPFFAYLSICIRVCVCVCVCVCFLLLIRLKGK